MLESANKFAPARHALDADIHVTTEDKENWNTAQAAITAHKDTLEWLKQNLGKLKEMVNGV